MKLLSMSKRVLSNLETCITFQKNKDLWHHLLMVDVVYLHAMTFVTQIFFDRVLGRRTTDTDKSASLHLQKTLRFLRERLSHEKNKQGSPMAPQWSSYS
ncbi:hypothetical protein BDV29DRAFT_183755 [Aspergillus leporis]|uniref:Uncharacterized protein n=1 Tax=Aspergillus leporis TaxID=41062 RepID=A0A5N5WK32_9EURO|nr:hypothetical protein BDV29DRAFT_183755 [Aspergillus leporis]